MRENHKPAKCHPDRRHAAKGLCFPCYVEQYPKTQRASCHSDRIAHAKGLCRVCYDRELKESNVEYAQAQRQNFERWSADNTERVKAYSEQYVRDPRNRQRHKENDRAATLSRFGLSWEDELRILDEQGGVCAICGGDSGNKQWFDIDHDHKTQEFRGLICGRCNKGLGLLGDSVEGVTKALRYLEAHNQRMRERK